MRARPGGCIHSLAAVVHRFFTALGKHETRFRAYKGPHEILAW